MPADEAPPISLLAFFLLWAERQRWVVPDVHIRACDWLEHRGPLALMQCFRGFSKSTLLGVYNAWRYYSNRQYRILHQSESDGTAYKTSRDTQNVLRHHPLTRGLLPSGQGTVEQWWVNGADDSRNASMYAKGILSNVTSSRADEVQNDDVEVPRNIGTPEARDKLRYRLGEQTHILVPGGRQLYVGTPHSHETLYDDVRALGADTLVIRLFEREHRLEKAASRQRVPFVPELVFTGIGSAARQLVSGKDYTLENGWLTLHSAIGDLVDVYAGCAWPERFNAEELTSRRRKCRTLNEWDSQYQLHAKPVRDVRLDPARITPYDVPATLRFANGGVGMFLGEAQIVAASLRWDPSAGKLKSDVSAAALVLQDAAGRRYLHRVQALRGDVAEFDEDGKSITGGQVWQLAALVEELQVPRITIETNGIGGFAPEVLKAALKQRRLRCGVAKITSTTAKNKRILETLEPLLLTRGQLWAHVDVLRGPLWQQMQDWNPAITEQPDDYLDAIAGAIAETPERIGKIVRNASPVEREDWRVDTGVHEVEFER